MISSGGAWIIRRSPPTTAGCLGPCTNPNLSFLRETDLNIRSGNLIEPSWFTLYTSRGIDEIPLKTFMRASVVLSEYATYVPAVILFTRIYAKLAGTSSYDRVKLLNILTLGIDLT